MSIAVCFALASADAQYVTIPDANFVSWLNTHGFASCMSGNQMDTTCAVVLHSQSINCGGASIHSLTGISYFHSLAELYCNGNQLTSIPTLPPFLQYFYCDGNHLTSLPSLPAYLYYFNCRKNFRYSF